MLLMRSSLCHSHPHPLSSFSFPLVNAAPAAGSPELETAINQHLNSISKCAFDGSCVAPEVLTMELKRARENDWQTVLHFLEEQASNAREEGGDAEPLERCENALHVSRNSVMEGEEARGVGEKRGNVLGDGTTRCKGERDPGRHEGGEDNIRAEIRLVFQRLLMQSRDEEGRRVRCFLN